MGTRGSRGSAEKSPASGWEHLSVWGTGPWPTLKGRAEPASKPSWRRALFGSITKLPIDAALRAPRSPAPPPPPKGEGEETRRGRRGGSPGPSSRRGAGGRGRPGSGRREAAGRALLRPARSLRPVPTAAARIPAPGWSFPRSKFTLFGARAPLLQARGKSAARGHRGAPVVPGALPPRCGLPANLGARSGVSARGRESRPGGPRLQFVPSPSLPSPCRRRREEGAVGQARAECAAGAGRLSRSPAGCPRGRTGVAAYPRGTPGSRPLALAGTAKWPSNRCWHSQGGPAGLPQTGPAGPGKECRQSPGFLSTGRP